MKEFYGEPAFRRLLVWLNANDGSGYGCVELNSVEDTVDFIDQLSKSCGKEIVEVNYSKSRPDRNCDLIVEGQQYLTMEGFRKRYGDEAVLVITYLDESVDEDNDSEVKALVNELNMNRENYVNYPSPVIFVMRKFLMDKIYQSAFDFTSMMGIHEDLTSINKDEIQQYIPRPNREMKEIYRDDFANAKMPIVERMRAAKKYIEICDYFYDRDGESLSTIREILSKFDEMKGENKKISDLDNEVFQLICSNPLFKRIFKEWVDKRMNNSGKEFAHSRLEYYVLSMSPEPLEWNLRQAYSPAVTATNYNIMASVFRAQGDYGKALKYYRKALDIQDHFLGPEHPDKAATYNNMASVFRDQGDYEKALDYYKRAAAIYLIQLGESHPYTQDVLHSINYLEMRIQAETGGMKK